LRKQKQWHATKINVFGIWSQSMPSYHPDTETLRGDWPPTESTYIDTNDIRTPEEQRADAEAVRCIFDRLSQIEGGDWSMKIIIEDLNRVERRLKILGYHVAADHCSTAAYMLEEDGK